MDDLAHRALLPAGLGDMLPPEAAMEAQAIDALMATCTAHGYQRVKPPLVEFEDSLLAGAGAATAAQTFRVMDPVSQRMMGVRADMTLQIARIATVRLADQPRPLRLTYAGQVLRVKGTQLRPERQFAEVGAELIGSDSAPADAEAVLLAVTALRRVGLQELSVDLGLPTLVGTVAGAYGLDPAQVSALHRALERKDETDLMAALDEAVLGRDVAATLRALFVGLLRAAGPAAAAVAALAGLDLPPAARAETERLAAVVALIAAADPALRLTVDPVEYRGFEYHTGVSFTLFALGIRGELGRGGRYLAGHEGRAEPATGFTVYLDSVLQGLAPPATGNRLYLPSGTAWAAHLLWQQQGFVTVAGLDQAADDHAAAARAHGCSHVLRHGRAERI